MGLTKLEKCIAFLYEHGASNTKHSGRTLYVHLKRTYEILQAANLSEDVCFAGLFHSIYGNNIFNHQTLCSADRKKLQNLIGDYAEQLAWAFCSLERPSSLQAYVNGERVLKHSNGNFWAVDEKDCLLIEDLLSIEAANLLDQQVLWRNKWLIPHARNVGLLTVSGYNVLRESKNYLESRQQEIEGMLDSARQGARAILINKLNQFRSSLASDALFAMDLRKLKLQQALNVIEAEASGILKNLEFDNYELIKNYAESYGIDLIDASKHIVNLCSKHETGLYKSELLKDKFSGMLVNAKTLSEIDRIKREISALPDEFWMQ